MKSRIAFTKCVLNIQKVNSSADDDRMVSRLYFTLNVAGKNYEMQMEIRQPPGFVYSDADQYPIETSLPQGDFKGPWHHDSLNKAAEDYYRGIIGAKGSLFFGSEAKKLTMSNLIFTDSKKYDIIIPDKGSGGW